MMGRNTIALWWLVMVMIALYVFWCAFHGVMLKKSPRARGLRSVRAIGCGLPNQRLHLTRLS
jgi:hypothetical protein